MKKKKNILGKKFLQKYLEKPLAKSVFQKCFGLYSFSFLSARELRVILHKSLDFFQTGKNQIRKKIEKLISIKICFIIFFMLFFQGVFGEEEKIACIENINKEFKSLLDKKKLSTSGNFEVKSINEIDKIKIESFNFRNFLCYSEDICFELEQSILKKEKNEKRKFPNCFDNFEISENTASSCQTENLDTAIKIIGYCHNAKKRYIAFEKVSSLNNFYFYSKNENTDLLGAKMFSINTKMRKLFDEMFKLKNYMHKIAVKVFCLEK